MTPISLTQESKNQSKLYTPKSPGSLAGGAEDPNGSSESSSLGNLSPLKLQNLSGSRTPKTPRTPRSLESLEASLIEAGDLSPHSSNPSHTSTPNPFFDPNIFEKLLEDSINEDAVVLLETFLKESLTTEEIKTQREVYGRSDQAILRWAKEKEKKAQTVISQMLPLGTTVNTQNENLNNRQELRPKETKAPWEQRGSQWSQILS